MCGSLILSSGDCKDPPDFFQRPGLLVVRHPQRKTHRVNSCLGLHIPESPRFLDETGLAPLRVVCPSSDGRRTFCVFRPRSCTIQASRIINALASSDPPAPPGRPRRQSIEGRCEQGVGKGDYLRRSALVQAHHRLHAHGMIRDCTLSRRGAKNPAFKTRGFRPKC